MVAPGRYRLGGDSPYAQNAARLGNFLHREARHLLAVSVFILQVHHSLVIYWMALVDTSTTDWGH